MISNAMLRNAMLSNAMLSNAMLMLSNAMRNTNAKQCYWPHAILIQARENSSRADTSFAQQLKIK